MEDVNVKLNVTIIPTAYEHKRSRNGSMVSRTRFDTGSVGEEQRFSRVFDIPRIIGRQSNVGSG